MTNKVTTNSLICVQIIKSIPPGRFSPTSPRPSLRAASSGYTDLQNCFENLRCPKREGILAACQRREG